MSRAAGKRDPLSLVQIKPWYLALVDIDIDIDIDIYIDIDIHTLEQDTSGSQDQGQTVRE